MNSLAEMCAWLDITPRQMVVVLVFVGVIGFAVCTWFVRND